MTPSKLTSIKNAAAKEIAGYESITTATETILNLRNKRDLELLLDKVAELSYAEAMREVRDKLPTQEQIDTMAGKDDSSTNLIWGKLEGAKWAIEQIKKLLIP